MSINWFPGHMAKARRQIEEKLPLVDIIYELVDARIPYSSRNPMLNDILKRKPRIIILTKIDLADPTKTKLWVEHFEEQGLLTVQVNSLTKEGINKIVTTSKEVLKEKIQKDLNRGLKVRPIRALIVGIPNVGKSTLINRIVGKKAAAVGDRPGVTRAQQWIKITNELELLDTPGILWPRFESEIVGLNLAATGAIKEEILPKDNVAVFVMKFLNHHYQRPFFARYGLTSFDEEDIVAAYEAIGRKRGCFASGGVVDYDKVTDLLLRDLKDGQFGKVTFEVPSDVEECEE